MSAESVVDPLRLAPSRRWPTVEAAMRLHLEHPKLLDRLVVYLRSRNDAVVELLAPDRVEVSLLGSYSEDAMIAELERRLERWRAPQAPEAGDRDNVVDICDRLAERARAAG
jgi:hypothetical protein